MESIQNSDKERLQAEHLLACSPLRNFPCKFTENCFAIFDQSSHVILLMWFSQLYFFLWIPCGNPLDGSVKHFLSNRRGWIWFNFVLVACIFFYFKSGMFELQKIFLLIRFFNWISCNKGLKAKILRFYKCFFCLNPWGLECSRSRKTAFHS